MMLKASLDYRALARQENEEVGECAQCNVDRPEMQLMARRSEYPPPEGGEATFLIRSRTILAPSWRRTQGQGQG